MEPASRDGSWNADANADADDDGHGRHVPRAVLPDAVAASAGHRNARGESGIDAAVPAGAGAVSADGSAVSGASAATAGWIVGGASCSSRCGVW